MNKKKYKLRSDRGEPRISRVKNVSRLKRIYECLAADDVYDRGVGRDGDENSDFHPVLITIFHASKTLAQTHSNTDFAPSL